MKSFWPLVLLLGFLAACAASAAVPKEVIEKWIAEFKSTQKCSKECKNFVQTCTSSDQLNSADKLNDVSERINIGFTYAYFNVTYNKFYENDILLVFQKEKGVWTIVKASEMFDSKQCRSI